MLHNGAPRENKSLILPECPALSLSSPPLPLFLNCIPQFPLNLLSLLVRSLPPLTTVVPHTRQSSSLSLFRRPSSSLCISCIVNSSQKRDKVSARVPPASPLCSPSYLLLSPRYRVCVCLFIRFFLCVRKAKVN